MLKIRHLLVLLLTAPTALSAQSLPFSDRRWELKGDSTRIESFEGRETLRFETGSAERRDIRLEDGTIDVDVLVTSRRSFVYLNFRLQSDGEGEEFYLRPHKSGLPDAAQYAPVYQGESAWQLYHGARGTAAPTIVPGVWQHLRIVLSGRRAAFFLGDTLTPFMVLPHLARIPQSGYIGVRSFVPQGTPGAGPAARFANLSVRPGVTAYDFAHLPAEPVAMPGTIEHWEIGEGFAAPETPPAEIASAWARHFVSAPIEPDGFVELHRYVTMPEVQRYVGVVARIHVVARAAGMKRLELGFSDRVTVFLNGRPVVSRDDSYSYENRRDGLISFDQATVYLPLRAGLNEISLIVSDRFGGWGIMGRFPDILGLTLVMPRGVKPSVVRPGG